MCPAPCEGGALKALSVRSATHHVLVTLSCLAMAAFAAETAPMSKIGVKMPHPEQPEAQRTGKNELTTELTRLLLRRPRIEVKRRNYIDDYIDHYRFASTTVFS